jgi:L-alanine-DL-glutamate epimerase-like enolase superfamily enzyme
MNLAWETFTIQAKHPFKISRSVQESVERVWVRVTEDGQEGWGEADPSPYYGETAATVGYALERLRPPPFRTSTDWRPWSGNCERRSTRTGRRGPP